MTRLPATDCVPTYCIKVERPIMDCLVPELLLRSLYVNQVEAGRDIFGKNVVVGSGNRPLHDHPFGWKQRPIISQDDAAVELDPIERNDVFACEQLDHCLAAFIVDEKPIAILFLPVNYGAGKTKAKWIAPGILALPWNVGHLHIVNVKIIPPNLVHLSPPAASVGRSHSGKGLVRFFLTSTSHHLL